MTFHFLVSKILLVFSVLLLLIFYVLYFITVVTSVQKICVVKQAVVSSLSLSLLQTQIVSLVGIS
jgi:hypothetical protein